MKPLYLAMILGLTTLVAACDGNAETNMMANTTVGDMAMNNMAGDMGNMAMPTGSDTTMAKGTGTVAALDKTTGSITIDHGPMPEANWPAMTMQFQVKPELLDGLNAGDKVAFDLALKNGSGAITAIRKQ